MLLREIESYKNLELLARQVVQGFISGLHKSPLHGFSVEFAEHRQYNRGEGVRHVDWKLYAKTDKLFVKKYEEETNLRCRIMLDVSPSMFFPGDKCDKLRFSVIAAAAIMQLMKKQRDAFGLTLFDEKVTYESDIRSSLTHFGEMLGKLQPYWDNAVMPAQGKSSGIASTLEYMASTLKKRSFLVIFTDMFDQAAETDLEPVWNALKHLKFNQHEIILFNVRHAPQEVEFNYATGPHKFVDLESGEKILLNPDSIRETYTRAMEGFDRYIREKCLQYKIDLYQTDVSRDFDQVLTPFFVRRMRI